MHSKQSFPQSGSLALGSLLIMLAVVALLAVACVATRSVDSQTPTQSKATPIPPATSTSALSPTAVGTSDRRSPTPQGVNPTSNSTVPPPTPVTPPAGQAASIIDSLPLWAPDLKWQDPKTGTDMANGKQVSGISRTGLGTSPSDVFAETPKVHQELAKRGWKTDGPADSPGFSAYTYTITEQGKNRVVTITFRTKAAIVSRDPIKFAPCPCQYEVAVFYSNPF